MNPSYSEFVIYFIKTTFNCDTFATLLIKISQIITQLTSIAPKRCGMQMTRGKGGQGGKRYRAGLFSLIRGLHIKAVARLELYVVVYILSSSSSLIIC